MTTVPTVPKKTLLSIYPVQGLLSQLESGTIATPNNQTELQALWLRANTEFSRLPLNRSTLVDGDIIPLDIDNEKISAIKEKLKKYPTYNTHSFDICDVNISKLITPQITINLNRADKRADIHEGMTMDNLFDVSFELSSNIPEITRQILTMNPNGGSIQFTSYDEDIRIHSPPHFVNLPVNENDHDGANLESVSYLIGGGLPFAVAYKIEVQPNNFRLILGNGIHRVYKFASLGYERIPLAVCDFTQMEIPNPFVDVQKDILLGSKPPMLVDFVNDDVVISLEYYTQLKTIRLNWTTENYTTVLK